VLQLDPLREDAQRGLLEVLHGLGERDEALAQFRQYTALLRRELDAEPSRELQALYRELLAG
jgi:DNA-binding SARP family transcriptional activator